MNKASRAFDRTDATSGKARRTAIRTCAGCGERAARDALLRFARPKDCDRPTPDIRKRAPGRGLSVHPRPRCLRGAVKRGAFRRAFSAGVATTADELIEAATGQYGTRIDALLAAAHRNRRLRCGASAVRETVCSREASLVVVARNASERLRCVAATAETVGARGIVTGTKARLGRVSGRGPVAGLVVFDPGLAERISRAATFAAALEEDA